MAYFAAGKTRRRLRKRVPRHRRVRRVPARFAVEAPRSLRGFPRLLRWLQPLPPRHHPGGSRAAGRVRHPKANEFAAGKPEVRLRGRVRGVGACGASPRGSQLKPRAVCGAFRGRRGGFSRSRRGTIQAGPGPRGASAIPRRMNSRLGKRDVRLRGRVPWRRACGASPRRLRLKPARFAGLSAVVAAASAAPAREDPDGSRATARPPSRRMNSRLGKRDVRLRGRVLRRRRVRRVPAAFAVEAPHGLRGFPRSSRRLQPLPPRNRPDGSLSRYSLFPVPYSL
jgi:hypothetical protein